MKQRERTRWVAAAVLTAAVLAIPTALSAAEAPELTARDAVERAFEHDDGLRQQWLTLRIARLELEAAEASAYLPTIDLGVTLPEWTNEGWSSELSGTLSVNLPLPWATGSGLTAAVGLGIDLDDLAAADLTWRLNLLQTFDLATLGGGTAQIGARRSAVHSAERALTDSIQALVRSVLEDYAALLGLRLQAEIDAANEDAVSSDLAATERDAADGYASESDLVDARIRLLEAEIRSEKSRQAYEDAMGTFCRETIGLEGGFEPVDVTLDLDGLAAEATSLIENGEITAELIDAEETVRSALDGVETARETLATARADALPRLSLDASVDAARWSVGFGLSFDLFAPDRWTNVRIAEAELALATERLEAARRDAEDRLIGLRRDLESAAEDVRLLRLETEKWALEESATTSRYDAGLVSVDAWDEFEEELRSFRVDAAAREMSLLTAYLAYRAALGLEATWEEWLQ